MPQFTLQQGDVQARLAEMAAESVQCVVTSPPYWGLRDYKLEPQVWGAPKADNRFREVVERVAAENTAMPEHLQSALTAVRAEGCEHEWGDKQIRGGPAQVNTGGNSVRVGRSNLKEQERRNDSLGQFCSRCNAWRGSLGLEPTPELYIEHVVQVFREVLRVLRKDGTLWLNMGDSYSSGGGAQVVQTKNASHGLEGMRAKTPGMASKQLLGIPWRVALALQVDGWWLRSDIVWHKPNCMPGSQRDRPTTAHEYLFLLTKSARYFFDQEAVREPLAAPIHKPGNKDPGQIQGTKEHQGGNSQFRDSTEREWGSASGRNIRSVWTIATQPFPEAHFAVFPEKLVEPCIKAGTSEHGCCPECGAPWKRMVEKDVEYTRNSKGRSETYREDAGNEGGPTRLHLRPVVHTQTTGWQPTCDCGGDLVPCTVLDPFAGAGTALLVALRLGRAAIGIELSPDYCEMARLRILADAPLLNQEGAA